jgi:histidinol-phosphate aminotransferase
VLNAECALFALEHQQVFQAQAQAIRSERERMSAALGLLKGVKVFPSQANMLLVRFEGAEDVATRLFEALRERGILVKNVSKMHPLLRRCLRPSVGTPQENDVFLAVLTELWTPMAPASI